MPTAGYFLQLDIANFFNGIHQPTLLELLAKKLRKAVRRRGMDVEQARLCYQVAREIIRQPCAAEAIRLPSAQPAQNRVPPHKRLENAPPDTGLPIGNLTSQFFANVYLNELDQFVKHELKCRHYVRYVDDFVLLHEDREQLVRWREAIAIFLRERLRLELKPRDRLAPLGNGADFLGYIVRPDYRLVRRRVVGNLRERLARHAAELCRPHRGGMLLDLRPEPRDALRATLASYWGHFRHADSHRLRRSILRRYAWLNGLFDDAAPATALDSRVRGNDGSVRGQDGGALHGTGGGDLRGDAPLPSFRTGAQRTIRNPGGWHALDSRVRGNDGSVRGNDGGVPADATLTPRWEAPQAASMAAQWRWFRRNWPDAVLLMQCGRHLLLAEPLPGARAYDGPSRIEAWRVPIGALGAIRRHCERRRKAYLFVSEQGWHRGGLKRRCLRLLWSADHRLNESSIADSMIEDPKIHPSIEGASA
jgi:hypothetical protein